MRLRKMSDKYHFDLGFYLTVLGFAGLIYGVYWQAMRTYNRSRGAEVQALLDRENAMSVDAFRKQAKNWVNGRAQGIKLTEKERAMAEDIVAHGLHNRVMLWTQGQMKSKSKEEIDHEQKIQWAGALADLDAYLASIGKGSSAP